MLYFLLELVLHFSSSLVRGLIHLSGHIVSKKGWLGKTYYSSNALHQLVKWYYSTTYCIMISMDTSLMCTAVSDSYSLAHRQKCGPLYNGHLYHTSSLTFVTLDNDYWTRITTLVPMAMIHHMLLSCSAWCSCWTVMKDPFYSTPSEKGESRLRKIKQASQLDEVTCHKCLRLTPEFSKGFHFLFKPSNFSLQQCFFYQIIVYSRSEPLNLASRVLCNWHVCSSLTSPKIAKVLHSEHVIVKSASAVISQYR